MAIQSATAAAATDTAAVGRARLAESFDTFLSLLTVQLKNQDPLSPMDSNQFTQQIVQMTGVEQQLLTNDLLKKLVSNSSGGIAGAVSLIGKNVKAVSAEAALNAGEAQWVYSLDRAASDLRIEVRDSTGRIVHAASPSGTGAGQHAFTWNGRDGAGARLANGGTYTLKITATDGSGAAVTSTTYVQGAVSGVEQKDGQTLIVVNGGRVPWDQVTTITNPGA